MGVGLDGEGVLVDRIIKAMDTMVYNTCFMYMQSEGKPYDITGTKQYRPLPFYRI